MLRPDFQDNRLLRFEHAAMATTFEIFISTARPEYARDAAREAFHLIDQLESELSRFREKSDVYRLNHTPPNTAVPLGLAAMECLAVSLHAWQMSGGAFDITIGALADFWKKTTPGESPDLDLLDGAGMHNLSIDPETRWVARANEYTSVDFGAVAKGYALDQISNLLEHDWEFDTFLVHTGWSSCLAVSPPGAPSPWTIALDIQQPARLELGNLALSGSAVQLKSQHIVDPRTGAPAPRTRRAWAVAPSAALSDAYSTAFMLLEVTDIKEICAEIRDLGALVYQENSKELQPIGLPDDCRLIS